MKVCSRVTVSLFVFSIFSTFLHAQNPPKRELRAAWIATVVNLDWPANRGADPSTQRTELASLLDALKAVGINSVVFQVRPECDALYALSFEPWSYWLTGAQGRDPVSPFDPLQFALDEAHKRGMEIHAWFNPYRAERIVGSYPLARNHIAAKRPDLTKDYPIYGGTSPNRKLTGYLRILNPGIPEVQEYVRSVVMNVVRNYDIDGVHFDDYFYPYPTTDSLNQNVPFPDTDTYYQYNPKGLSLGDWRRDNVNTLIKMIFDSSRVTKPQVKFGISPFGIWKSNTPSGITGLSAYFDIYCDAVEWLGREWIDYIAPQLYWPLGGSQDYSKLMPWWSGVRNDRHFYPGQAAYRITDGNWGASELPNQIRLNRVNSSAQGSVFFRAKYGVTNNPKGFADSLKNDLYKYPALRPLMTWKETVPPNVPSGLTISKFSSPAIVSWSAPPPASDGGVADQYVLYRSTSLPIQVEDARNIVAIQGTTSYFEQPLPSSGVTYYYGVTAVDRLQNESALSNVMGLNATGVVAVRQTENLPKEFVLLQNYPNPFNPSTAISYQLSAISFVSLKVYDVLGRDVATLVDGVRNAGTHTVRWNASSMPSGVYVYCLRASDAVTGSKQFYFESKKMLLVR